MSWDQRGENRRLLGPMRTEPHSLRSLLPRHWDARRAGLRVPLHPERKPKPSRLTSPPPWPHHGRPSAIPQVHAAFRPPLPRIRPGADQDRAARRALVCARLYRRHPARLDLCPRDHPGRAAVGRPGADDGPRLRRFHPVGDARHHCRRATGLCGALQSGIFCGQSGRDRAAVERRHVVPRRLSRLRARGGPVCALPRHSHPVARRRDLRGWPDRPVFRPRRQFHQWRAVGAADRCRLGRGISRPAARSRAIPANSTKRSWRAWSCLWCLRS